MFGWSLYVWMPHMFGTPICLDAHLYVWTTPHVCTASYVWMSPMFGHSSVWLDASTYLDPLYVWMPSICSAAPLYVWMLPNLWWQPKVWGTSKHMWVSKHTGASKHGGIQIYGGIWTPPQSDKAYFLCVVYVQQASKHLPNIWGHPNIQGGIQTWGASKHTGDYPSIWGHPNVWGHMDTLSVWQSMFSLCCICTAGIQTSSKHMGASK